jgi:hypothetical protein
MNKATAVRVGRADDRRRRPRRHTLPRWLKNGADLDAIARSRCLMMLSVISGETPVTTAIAQAKISRATYYKLETRALNAMLAAMNPLAGQAADGRADLSAASHRIAELEGKVRLLERDKRRVERLWLLTRRTLKAPIVSGRRGPRRRLVAASTPTSPGASSH